MKRCFSLILFSLCFVRVAFADAFVISDIRVVGLQRLTAGSVFNYVPYRVGDSVSEADYARIIRALYETSFFETVDLRRDGDVLVIDVIERPVIGELNIEGNRDLGTDTLQDGLRGMGLILGNPYDPARARDIERELYELYYSRGKYDVIITMNVAEVGAGRVGVDIVIQEGITARIKSINIVGNRAFSESYLLDKMKQTTTKWHSYLTQGDRYSGLKLQADSENLEAFYADRGFLDFKITSTQVMLTPDKEDVFITVNLSEGLPYRLEKYQVIGNDEVTQVEKDAAVTIAPEAWYSRKKVYASRDALKRAYEAKGYAFAKVMLLPKVNRQAHTVDLTFRVDTGKRVYVRRIEIDGNFYTHDEVIRRELRQMEAAVYAGDKVSRSTERVQRLPSIERVEIKKVPVKGTNDQVDLVYKVKESGERYLEGGITYSPNTGSVGLSGSYNSLNFLGTGNEFSFSASTSAETKRFDMSFTNPYYTIDGISAGFRLFYERNDQGAAKISDWIMNRYGAFVNFGFPVNEDEKFDIGFGYRNIDIRTGKNIAEEIPKALDEYDGKKTKDGKQFDEFVATFNWTHDTLDRPFFSNKGAITRISAEATLPGSDLTYFKLGVRNRTFFSLTDDFVLSIRGDISYGDGYGETKELPFYTRYYAGGLTTVRAYQTNSLGPRYKNSDVSGGNFRITGGAELIFPWRLTGEEDSARVGAFADFGNVFIDNSEFDLNRDDFRYSAGFFLLWKTPFGPRMNLSYGWPLNKQKGDKQESLQLSFGLGF